MRNNLSLQFQVFYHLINRNLLVFSKEYKSKLIDACIMLSSTVIIFSYFMSSAGIDKHYGKFILVGALASFGFFEIVGRVSSLLADINGDRTISYYLTLPLPSWLALSSIAVGWACNSFLLTLPLYPLGKLLLFTEIYFKDISCIKFIFIYCTINIFFGFFALWLTTMIRKVQEVSLIWIRIINPIFLFGCYFYSWQSAYEMSHVIGWLSLLNPVVYVMEGMRATILGQHGYLSFWYSIIMLWGFILFCAWHSIVRLKKQLDCI